MDSLPSSVEQYLLEAGFSATEVLLLRKLFTEDALTLRELAAKTGRSTGVLDAAIKKLERKNIVKRQWVNGAFKFALGDLQAVSRWTKEDMAAKHEMLERRHQNFETFIRSVTVDKSRPEMQYFDGSDGLQQAYERLLDEGKEFLHFFPVMVSEQDDPLRDFRVQYFRARRRRGIFSRVIAHNTPLGRRYQSRDPFEYRQTLLVPEEQCPFSFEKVIVGDTVACFNHAEKRACLMRYPEMAKTERESFEMLWKHLSGAASIGGNGDAKPAAPVTPSFSTRTLSGLREFFLSRRSLATFAVFAVVAAVLTFAMRQYTRELTLQRMKDKVQSIAATGTFQFDPKDLEALQVEDDWRRPEWAKVVNQLKTIRVNNENILYVYLLRKSHSDPAKIAFIADSHSLNPYANTDDNPYNDVDVGDGGSALLQWPGQPYPDVPEEVFTGFDRATTTQEFYTDAWWTFISGYAPIRDMNGESVAVLAVDMQAVKLDEFMKDFRPFLYFLGFFFLFVIVRMSAFNRSLAQELWKALQVRQVLAALGLCAVISLAITYGLYQYTLHLMKQEIGARLMSIAATAAPEFDVDDLNQLHWAKDMKTDAYQRVFKKLNEIRDQNTDIKFVYILRPTAEEGIWEFVADADTNMDLPFYVSDFNDDGVLDSADEQAPPGKAYDMASSSEVTTREGLLRPMYSINSTADQWGMFLTGSAPIVDERGKAVALLGLDIEVGDLYKTIRRKFQIGIWFSSIFLTIIIAQYLLHFGKPHVDIATLLCMNR